MLMLLTVNRLSLVKSMIKFLSNKKLLGLNIPNIELLLTLLMMKEEQAFLVRRSTKLLQEDPLLNIDKSNKSLLLKNIKVRRSSTRLEESQEDNMLLSVKRLNLRRKSSKLERRQRPEDKSFKKSKRLSVNPLKRSSRPRFLSSSKEFMKLLLKCNRLSLKSNKSK